ncbi:MAG: hypothetical protein ABS63_01820 [Microbacterium sp. SCN 70-27]|uniref:NTP transferase domain-containing protein n=1 Tax=unclassified Microbacterium TaxID=2609290 RepID=UPI00086E6968|nr:MULTISPECIES: NTP transferase domain-containing protein [unclassified Microbacterium]MBN9225389.1 NTP transferase domain-containing protein [Microbacterium sp.]ODT29027.1 MAG: hypothetical protein ABS63_01820 [Microbacterium sp. SCN 70-27]
MKIPQLVIPMTGVSSRFTAAGYDRPKFLLEVEGETVLDHVIDMYPGWDDVVFCCNEAHLADPDLDLRRRILDRRPSATIVSVPNRRLGPGWAVLAAREHIDLDRPVVVNYCDFTCYWNPEDLARELSTPGVDGCIPCYTGAHPHMAFSTSYAYVKLRSDGTVADIQEKQPWTDDPTSEFASSGTYGFATGRILLDALDAQVEQKLTLGDEYYLSLTYKPMLEAGAVVSILALQHFMQWGTPQDFEEYRDASRSLAEWIRRPTIDDQRRTLASRVVLASGAGRRFADAGYRLPKPALPLAGITLLEHAVHSIPGAHTVVVGRTDLDDDGIVATVASGLSATLTELPGLSRGQADSARTGLLEVPAELPVTVTACDAIPVAGGERLQAALDRVGPDGLVVWTARPYSLARRRPEQYGWVHIDEDGEVRRTSLKSDPHDADAGVMIGTFSFGSARSAIEHIDALIADDETVNGEYYLDSLVQRLVDCGIPVHALLLDSFVSVGTPTEYETVRYWQSCFHKWPLHPYSFGGDPLVPATSRVDLDVEARRFDPRAHLTANRIR